MEIQETHVFNRNTTHDPILSPAAYNAAIGLTLCWGFAMNWLMLTNITSEFIADIDPFLFFSGYFASCFFGIYLFSHSSHPLVSFIGYNFIVVPFGSVVNLLVSQYEPTVVFEAIRTTGSVTLGMMCLGTLFPAFFQKIVGALTLSLFMLLVIELIDAFVFGIHHNTTDWLVALIFCGYIGYDWGRANKIPKTLDNAIDSAAALYMDIINLFLRILNLRGE